LACRREDIGKTNEIGVEMMSFVSTNNLIDIKELNIGDIA
jgi:hypothetical protein